MIPGLERRVSSFGDEPVGQHPLARIPLSALSMPFGIALEEFVASEVTLPVQFHRIWNEPSTATPERTLAMSVLCQAASDLRQLRYARRPRGQRLYMDAYTWVASTDRSWPYSFLNLCETLRLSPECVRAELLGDAVPAQSSLRRGAAGGTSRALRFGFLTSVPGKRCRKSAYSRGSR